MKDISEMTDGEVMEELAFYAFQKILENARAKARAAQRAEAKVIQALEDFCLDASEIKTEAENADNLLEAILCYLQYGEYSISGIMKELRAAWRAQE